MYIIINVPEKEYKRMKLLRALSSDNECLRYILEGTPLPKGHGRLIDADVIDDNIYDLTRGLDLNYNQIIDVLDDVPTIIPADKE